QHHHDYRHSQPCHLPQIESDRLRLPTLLCIDARIRAGRVNKGNDRPAKFFSKLHHSQCFAIAFRLRHTEVSDLALFRVPALLLADDSHLAASETCKPRYHSRIIRIPAIPVHLDKAFEYRIE